MRKWPINPSPNEGETHLEDNTPDTQDSSTIPVTIGLDVLEFLIKALADPRMRNHPMVRIACNAANEARANADASVSEQARTNETLSPEDEEARYHEKCEELRNRDINKFRIALVDNYNRENVSDIFHSSYDTQDEAANKCEELRANLGFEPARWPTVYEPGKKLYVFEI